MASGTLYTYDGNYRAYKALIAAQYGGGNVKLSPNFVFGETNKSQDFLKKFPLGKVPAFESTDGQYLTESNAIAYYVANNDLRGKSDIEKAQICQWLSFADNDLVPAASTWYFPYLGIIGFEKQQVEAAKSEMKTLLTYLNNHLLTRTYLVSESVTLADISVACTLLPVYQLVMEPSFRKNFQNVNRWFTTIINQPKIKAVIGEVKLCDKLKHVSESKSGHDDGKKHKKSSESENQQGAKGDSGKKDKKKGKKEKQEPAAANETNKEELDETNKEELDPTEEALAAEPKSKDPFSLLPKGTFIMDEFKKCYSNEDTVKSIPFFWEHFDKENYSIWLGEYKYNDELQKVFMSCNLITGMFQRLDKMRSQTFSSVCLFGTDNNCSISGIWIWRGHELAFKLSADWQIDYESYDWSKLNPDDETTKKLVQQYFEWSGEDKSGRKFNQGKIFK